MKADFEQNGFVIVRNFLSRADLAELTGGFHGPNGTPIPHDKTNSYCHDGPESVSRITLPPMPHPEWHATAAALLDMRVKCEATYWLNKPPGFDIPTEPHQDNFIQRAKPADALTIWMALAPVESDNGPVCYLPGSHRQYRSHDGFRSIWSSHRLALTPEEIARGVEVHLEPGDACIHHCLTVHWAQANRSTRHRPAIAQVWWGAHAERDTVSIGA